MAEVRESYSGRHGPVFLELPLDVQAASVPETWTALPFQDIVVQQSRTPRVEAQIIADVAQRLAGAERPVLLLGGGLSHQQARSLRELLSELRLPIMTTWNGADRYPDGCDNYLGRPNTWGQRSSNIILQQADLVLVLGSRLGLQQTGFNWQEFVPLGDVIQVDIDVHELTKPNPQLCLAIEADADHFLVELLKHPLGDHNSWLDFARQVRKRLPLSEPCNLTPNGFLNPYDMVEHLSAICSVGDHIVPCSSGGAFTVMMQAFKLKLDQTMITNKSLASMGYGLSGAIGVSIADPDRRTVLVEGDGGFTQNLQELATVAVNQLNLKIFLFCNEGYASIRMTQKNYFEGAYLGCDVNSGLGFPDWQLLAQAYQIPCAQLGPDWSSDSSFLALWKSKGPALFLVPLHPEQTYYPKITSRVRESGGMESCPLHLMTPDLDQETQEFVFRYFP